jgi:CRISPR-associated protein Cmr2
LDALKELDYPRVSVQAVKKALPALRSMVEGLQHEPRTLAESLFQFEADVLYPERLDPSLLEREYGAINRQAAEKSRRTCQDLCRAVGAPPTYYAILVMDGDDMGTWLAGDHPRMPRFRDVMHPDVLPKFEALPEPDRSNWMSLLSKRRPLAANLHASLSTALSTFALRAVKFIIEQCHFGRVVYAGGDDLLAFLPVTRAITAARELYMLFTGQAKVTGGRIEVELESQNGYVKWDDEILLMPGPRITLSAGITIVHHLHPLDAALEAAREAEKHAKNALNGARAAVSVRAIKRSGETVDAYSRWAALGDNFEKLVDFFREEVPGKGSALSSRFAYDVIRSAYALNEADEKFKAELRRLLVRHRNDNHPNAPDPKEWAERLSRWADSMPRKSEELGGWLALARFVAQGGDE